MKKVISKLKNIARNTSPLDNRTDETSLLAIGKMLSNQQMLMHSNCINDYEFKIFSQFGDDGIIQYLIKKLTIKNEVFIEFGVENYMESNTRFLLMNNNWSGFVMDGSKEAMMSLQNRRWYWRYDLTQKSVFIDKENINSLLKNTEFKDIGILHIDLDGNDYFILQEIDFKDLNPSILILEYNSVFGKDRPISVPYNPLFNRTEAHFSNLFWGASLAALHHGAIKKGYALVCCNLAGNNAYYVRRDLLNDSVKEVTIDEAFKESKFRESRSLEYSLTYLNGEARLKAIKGLTVINVLTGKEEEL